MVWRVERESGSGETIGDEIDPEELNRDQSLRHTHSGSQEDRDDFSDVGRDEVADELLSVVVDGTTFFNGTFDGGKVVVYKHHVRGELGYIGSGAHSNTNISFLESRRVVDTVTSHSNNLTGLLEKVDEFGFVCWLSAGEEAGVLGGFHLLGLGKVVELATCERLASEIFIGAKDTDLTADGLGSVLIVSSDDYNTDTSGAALGD
jgi:hypothetical protein